MGGLWALECAWHSAEANLRSQKAQESACQVPIALHSFRRI